MLILLSALGLGITLVWFVIKTYQMEKSIDFCIGYVVFLIIALFCFLIFGIGILAILCGL